MSEINTTNGQVTDKGSFSEALKLMKENGCGIAGCNVPFTNADDLRKQLESKNKQDYSKEFMQIASSLGAIAGIIYAFKKKTGFWKGWGISIVGGLVVGGLGYGVGKLVKKK